MSPAPMQSIVITGAGTGIGAATALSLAAKGWQVFAGVLSTKEGDALLRLQTEQSPSGKVQHITPLVMDVTKNETLLAAAAAVEAAVGSSGLQALLCCAGKSVNAPVELFPQEAFESVVDVNFLGVLRTSQAFLPVLRKGKAKGRIVSIGSVTGTIPMPLWSAYCTSKAALESLSECMRYELEPHGIPVVLIKAGPVKTPIWEATKDATDAVTKHMSLKGQVMYGDMIDKMNIAINKAAEVDSISVDAMVKVVVQAVTAKSPSSCYVVGKSSGTLLTLKSLLPAWAFDRILKASFNL